MLGKKKSQGPKSTSQQEESKCTSQQQKPADSSQKPSTSQKQQSCSSQQQQQLSSYTKQGWPSLGTQQQRLPHSTQAQSSSGTQQTTPGAQQQQVAQGSQQAWASRGTQQQQTTPSTQQQVSQGSRQAWSSRGTQQKQSAHSTQQALPVHSVQQQQTTPGAQQQQVAQGSQQAWASRGTQQQPSAHSTQQALPVHSVQQQQTTPGAQQQQVAQGSQQAWASRGTQQQPSAHSTQQALPVHSVQQQQTTPGAQQQQVAQGSQQAWASRGTQQQPSAHSTQQALPVHSVQQQQTTPGAQQQQVAQGSQQAWASRGTQQQPSAHSTQQALPVHSVQQQQTTPGAQQQQVAQGSQQAWASRGTQQQPSAHSTQQALPARGVQQQQSPHGTKKRPLIYEDVEILVPIRSWPCGTHKPWPVSPISPNEFQSQQLSITKGTQEYFGLIPLKTSRSGGQAGRKITLETNMLALNFSRNFQTNIIHYDVDIVPDKPKCFLRTVFEEFRKIHCLKRYPAFDGRKNAYSGNDLPFGNESKVEEIDIFDKEHQKNRTFKISLKKVAVLDLSWLKNGSIGKFDNEIKQKCIQALDVILRHGPAYQYIPVGRSLFQQPEGRVVSLSNGLDLWVGVFQSVVIGSKPYLNIDVAHKGFPTEQPVINLMKEFCKNPKSNVLPEIITAADVRRNEEKITKFLKGLKVQYELPGQPTTKRTYPVNGLVAPPRNNRFNLSDGTKCTVEEYFLQTKKYKIKYNDLPCLWVGSKSTNIHVPPELCRVVAGQVLRKKMDDSQTTKMIREAATDAKTRKEKILKGFANMKLNDQPTLVNEFHFSVQGEFEKVPARVLEAPKLTYYERDVNVHKGIWKAEKFLDACTLPDNSWAILNLNKYVRDPELHELQSKLQKWGKFLNMNINKPQTPFRHLELQRDIRNIQEYFKEKKGQDIKLVIVILPHVEYGYSVIKQISEIHIAGGIVTQCIKQQTLKKLNDSTIGNILLKINSKLNGINHKLALPYRPPCLNIPCMIVGADVTHPSPDATNIPSIAAVAASHDPNAFQYNIEIRLQSPREEIISDLKQIMIKQLLHFYQKTGHKPRRLIFYRDGVSEGQLTQVIHHELFAIKEAIAQLEGTKYCMVPITFFVVQKRHHIRLFPTDARNSDDRNGNVQAGTIVDSEITHPTQIDFYLVSHASIQGTARPTKYRCIWNENGMHEDEIEELTYYLCHLFARCTRSVSYPAPTYYAHLAAFRARALIYNVALDLTNLEKEQKNKLNLQLNQNSPMFFV
ncbi:Protein argonaute-2 [Melipona quadrifasciata]|uniref:Protein argonaute-2 n=1 Tax=Melipona quadrifasciata TaxID=166423 RepID=A0A0M8ZR84_9HYME|nr:Protein argonaute-2 [Melipona quadrifasciata]